MDEQDIRNELMEAFGDREYRQTYADSFLDTYIAAQIKALREARGWSQQDLGERSGMHQSRISALENVNYSSWSIRTLRRLAKAFDLRLSVRFDSFGHLLEEVVSFKREALQEPSFAQDPVFQMDARALAEAETPKITPRSAQAGKANVTFVDFEPQGRDRVHIGRASSNPSSFLTQDYKEASVG
jgi:transcriptional regulator with XRE-family HTH domain